MLPTESTHAWIKVDGNMNKHNPIKKKFYSCVRKLSSPNKYKPYLRLRRISKNYARSCKITHFVNEKAYVQVLSNRYPSHHISSSSTSLSSQTPSNATNPQSLQNQDYHCSPTIHKSHQKLRQNIAQQTPNSLKSPFPRQFDRRPGQALTAYLDGRSPRGAILTFGGLAAPYNPLPQHPGRGVHGDNFYNRDGLYIGRRAVVNPFATICPGIIRPSLLLGTARERKETGELLCRLCGFGGSLTLFWILIFDNQ